MATLFFFIDGFGIGKRSKNNPLYNQGLWKHLIGLKGLTSNNIISKKNYCVIPTDAHLGIKGIPQSASGQSALFTGQNAPKLVEGHITGFPGETLKALIEEHSFLKRMKEKGFDVTSANAYSKKYFKEVKERNRRVSASTLTIQASKVPFRMMEELQEGRAVFMDITHHFLKLRYPHLKTIGTKRAAKNMLGLLEDHDLVMFEYFLTDYMGHRGTKQDKKLILKNLNGFLKALVQNADLKKHTIVICSDHGNIEEATSRKHSHNKVPTIVFSKNQKTKNWFIQRVKNLTDVPLTMEKELECRKN